MMLIAMMPIMERACEILSTKLSASSIASYFVLSWSPSLKVGGRVTPASPRDWIDRYRTKTGRQRRAAAGGCVGAPPSKRRSDADVARR